MRRGGGFHDDPLPVSRLWSSGVEGGDRSCRGSGGPSRKGGLGGGANGDITGGMVGGLVVRPQSRSDVGSRRNTRRGRRGYCGRDLATEAEINGVVGGSIGFRIAQADGDV
jgi:hypothetical protein